MITKNCRILITGCGGMLGEAIYSFFSKKSIVKATDIIVNDEWLSYIDVRDYSALEKDIQDFKPHAIFNLAALTDLEYCEKEIEEVYATNALGAENIALLCKKYNLIMIHISTAGIFDGKQEFYHDYDIPNPLSHYGRSKYAGELFVQKYLDRYFIFRPGWMMGGGPQKDKKFVNKIIKQIRAGKKELFVVTDKLGTPTYTYDFAANMYEMINSSLYGLYNMVCKGSGSRYDVAKYILRVFQLDKEIKLLQVDSNFFQKEYFAPRPYSEKLINMKLNLRGLNSMRHWKECLNEYLNKFNWLIG